MFAPADAPGTRGIAPEAARADGTDADGVRAAAAAAACIAPQTEAERAVRITDGGTVEVADRVGRYGMRGPLALDRLSLGPKETLLYRLKHVLSPAEGTPKPDGTTHLVFTPMQLLERLARLVPLPDRHMVRYFGVLAPSATWRAQVARPVEGTVLPRPGGRRIAWADPLRRVFLAEVLACACGGAREPSGQPVAVLGTRRVIAVIEEGPVARKILQHLGLPSAVPAVVPARIDRGDLWQTGPPTPHDRAAPVPDEFDQRDHLDAA